MILYNNSKVFQEEYNTTIKGLKNSYTFMSVLPKLAQKYLKGKNVLCMDSVTNFNFNNNPTVNFTHIGFYADTQEFFEIDDWFGINYMYFKEIKDTDNVELIIEDIKAYYKDSLINK